MEDREIVCVLGPSGSGKSTLLRAVAGLAPEATGHVRWNGADLAGVPPHRRGFGLMFQDHALFPHRDVIGNVSFGLRMQRAAAGRSRGAGRARRSRSVGLAGFDHRRVARAVGRRAAARRAGPRARARARGSSCSTSRSAPSTARCATGSWPSCARCSSSSASRSLFVTHDHDEAFGLADRVVVMHDGRIDQSGSPAEVWDHPADPFVARFLGWNVTTALGHGLVAVRPEGLRLTAAGGTAGVVTGRTFRRDHFLVEVEPVGQEPGADGPERLEVAVGLQEIVPEVGAAVEVELVLGAAVRFA